MAGYSISRERINPPPCGECMSESDQCQLHLEIISASACGVPLLVLAEQFFAVFDKADEHDNGGPREARKKHDLEHPHGNNCYLHDADCIAKLPIRLTNFGPFVWSKRRML